MTVAGRSRQRLAATFVAAATIAGGLAVAGGPVRAHADDGFALLHTFTNTPDGANPDGGLTLASNGRLYGTTNSGGCYAPGTVFSMAPGGSSYTVLHSFAWTKDTPPCDQGGYGWGDGRNPVAAPVDGGDGWMYGTTQNNFFANSGNDGVIYRMHLDGSSYQVIYDFLPDQVSQLGTSDGELLQASDGRLYGTAAVGGPGNCGGVYRVDHPVSDPPVGPSVQGVAFFCAAGVVDPPSHSRAALFQDTDGTFYGTSHDGGAQNFGTVFKMTVDTAGVGTVTTLHSFPQNSSEGTNPAWQLIKGIDGALYGTTSWGALSLGSVFRITQEGTLTVVSSLGWGRAPLSPLVQQPDGTLLGATWAGGANNDGTVFAVDHCGQVNYLHHFDSANGRDVIGNIVLTGSTLSGTTQSGGASPVPGAPADQGTAWALPIPAGAVDTVALTSSSNPANPGESVTFTATVSSPVATPSGSVTFFNGASAIGSSPISADQAALTTSALPPGDNAITARYCGVASPAINQVVGSTASSTTYTWKTVGNVDQLWSNAANWTPTGVPGAGDSAVIQDADVVGVPAIQLQNLTVSAGLNASSGLTGGNLSVSGSLAVSGDTVLNATSITVTTGASATFTGETLAGSPLARDSPYLEYGASVTNDGATTFSGSQPWYDYTGDSKFVNNGSAQIAAGAVLTGNTCCDNPGGFFNNGTVSVVTGTGATVGFNDMALDNNGALTIPAGLALQLEGHPSVFGTGATLAGAGRLLVSDTGSSSETLTTNADVTLNSGSTFELADGATLHDVAGHITGSGTFVWSGGTIDGSVTVDANVAFAITSASTKVLTANASLTAAGTTTFSGGGHIDELSSGLITNDGTWTVSGGSYFTSNAGASGVTNNGTLSVAPEGTQATLQNVDLINNGSLYPGGPGVAGVVSSSTKFTQTSTGTLYVDINSATSFDQLNFEGAATLAGTLAVATAGGFTPAAGQHYKVVGAGALTGTFDSFTGSNGVYTISYSDNPAYVQLDVAAAPTPPDDTAALTHVDPSNPNAPGASLRAGGPGRYLVQVSNVADGATTAPSSLELALPLGFVVAKTGGTDWTCSGAGPVVCSDAHVIAAHGSAGVLTVDVIVGVSAASGTATAHVSTAGDSNTANDTATDPTTVLPAIPAAGLTLTFAGPTSVMSGVTAGVSAQVSATGAGVSGPIEALVNLPLRAGVDSPPTVQASGNGWTCRTFALAGGPVARCQRDAGLDAGASAPPIALLIGTSGIPAGTNIVYTGETRGGGQFVPGVTISRSLTVLKVARARLHVASGGVAVLSPVSDQSLLIDVSNTGLGPTTGPLSATVSVPAGTAVTGYEGSGWTCSGGATLLCTRAGPLAASSAPPALALRVRGDRGSSPAVYSIKITGADPLGSLTAATTRVVLRLPPRPAILVVTRTNNPGGSTGYDVHVVNQGGGPSGPVLTVIEHLPAGTAGTGNGSGWACTVSGSTLACTGPGSIEPGAAAPLLHVSIANAPAGQAGGSVSVTGLVQEVSGTQQVISSSGTAGMVPVTAGLTLPQPWTVTLNPANQHVTRGQTSSVNVTLTRPHYDEPSGATPTCTSVDVAVVLGNGATVAGSLHAQSGCPNGSIFSSWCTVSAGSTPAAICTVGGQPQQNGNQDVLPVVAVFFNAKDAGGALPITAGFVDASTAAQQLQTKGTSALVRPVAVSLAVDGLAADAGPDQTVADRSYDSAGAEMPAQVTLDASKTPSSGHPLRYLWEQVQGPCVSWDAAPPDAASTVIVPLALLLGHPEFGIPGAHCPGTPLGGHGGIHPTFHLPLIRDQSALVFRLLVSDGSSIATRDVTVTVRPAGDHPPVIHSIQVLAQQPNGQFQTLAPGTVPSYQQLIRLRAVASDADSDPMTFSFKTSDPVLQQVVFTTHSDPSSVTFSWPRVLRLQITATAFDGHTRPDGVTCDASGVCSPGSATTPISGSLATTIGKGPVPLDLSLGGVDTSLLAAGSTRTVVAHINTAATGVTYAWTVGGVTQTATGRQLVVNAPAQVHPGDAPLVVALTATEGSMSDAQSETASVSIPLAAPPPITISVANLGSLAIAASGGADSLALQATATGGTGTLTYAWSLASGKGGLTGATTATPTLQVADGDAGTTLLHLVVSDNAGHSAALDIPVVVGQVTPAASGGSNPACAVVSQLESIAGPPVKPGALKLGGVTFDPGTLSFTGGPCDSTTSGSFSGASLTMAGGAVTASNLGGAVSSSSITLSSGSFSVAPSLKLGNITISSPITIDLGSGDVTGALTWTGRFPLYQLPASAGQISATLTFSPTKVSLHGTATLDKGGALTFDATFAVDGKSDSTATVNVTNLDVLGETLNGGATFTLPAGGGAPTAKVTLTGGPHDFPGGVHLAGVTVAWDANGLAFSGSGCWPSPAPSTLCGSAPNQLALSVTGSFADSANYQLHVTATPPASFAPFTGAPALQLDPTSKLQGTLASSGGTTTFDIRLDVSPTSPWQPVPGVSLSGLHLRLSNGTPDSACSVLHLAGGTTWLGVSGNGTVAIATGPTIAVDGEACVAPGSGAWALTSTANLGHWAPITQIPSLTIDSASAAAGSDGLGHTSVVLSGTITVAGTSCTGTLTLLPHLIADASCEAGKLSGLGLPLPSSLSGHVIYAEQASDPSSPYPLTVNGVTTPYVLQQGLTALAAFSLPSVLGKVGIASAAPVVVSANLGGANITLDAKIPTGTLKLFGDPANDRALWATMSGLDFKISTSGDFAIAASSTIHVPAGADGNGPGSQTLSATAALAIGVVPTLSVSASLTVQGLGTCTQMEVVVATNSLCDIGMPGMDISTVVIQGGITFNPPPAPPTPSIGFGATITHIPDKIAAMLGINQKPASEPMTFVINISEASPIFAIQLGVPDGNIFIRPLAFSPKLAETLQVDDASLIIAPFGGDVGTYHFDPGVHMRFDAIVLGTPVAARADLDVTAGKLDATLDVGKFTVAGITLNHTIGSLHVSPTSGLTSHFEGGVNLARGTGTAQTNSELLVNLDANAAIPGLGGSPKCPPPNQTSDCPIAFALAASAQHIPLGPVMLDSLTLGATAQLGTMVPVPQLTVSVLANATVLNVPIALGGSVSFDPILGVSGADLFMAGGPFTVGGVSIGGDGCHLNVPHAPTTGPCVHLGWNLYNSPVPTIHVAGSVDVSGFGVGIDGFIDNTGVGFSGHIDLPVVPQASAVQVSGRFYAGHLAGLTATDVNGAHVAVQDGDFTLSAGTPQPISLGGISLSALIDAGHLGHGHDWVRGNASVNVLGSNASIGGTVSRGHDHSGNVQYLYDLTGSGAVTLDGYLIAAGHVELSNNVLHVDGSLNVPHVTLSFGGNITESPLTYSFTGSLDVDMGFIHVSGAGSLSSTAGVTGQLTASAYKFATISGEIWVAPTGEACTGASASIASVLSGSVNLCTPGAGGISASLNILGYQFPTVNNLGSGLNFNINWGGGCITSGTFDGYYLEACASAQFQYPNPYEGFPGQGPLLATGSASGGYVDGDGNFHGLSISYDLGQKQACGSFLGYSKCVSF